MCRRASKAPPQSWYSGAAKVLPAPVSDGAGEIGAPGGGFATIPVLHAASRSPTSTPTAAGQTARRIWTDPPHWSREPRTVLHPEPAKPPGPAGAGRNGPGRAGAPLAGTA